MLRKTLTELQESDARRRCARGLARGLAVLAAAVALAAPATAGARGTGPGKGAGAAAGAGGGAAEGRDPGPGTGLRSAAATDAGAAAGAGAGAAGGPAEAAPACGVGLVLPLAGAHGDLGRRVAAAAEGVLGAAGVPSRRFDDRGDAAGASEAAAAAAEAGCVALLGGPGDAEGRALASAAADRGLALLSLSSAPGRGAREGVVHVRPGRDEAVAALARRLASEGVRVAHVLAPGSRYGRAQADAFREALEAAGGRVAALRVTGPADGDARALVASFAAQVRAARDDEACAAEVLFLPADGATATRWWGFLEAEGLLGAPSGEGCPAPLVAGTAAWNDPAVLRRFGAALEGARLGDRAGAGEEGATPPLLADAADAARLAVAAWRAAGGQAGPGGDAPSREAFRTALQTAALKGPEGDRRVAAGRLQGTAFATYTLRAGRPVPDEAPAAGPPP